MAVGGERSLGELIARAGRTPAPALDEFADMLAAAQRLRYERRLIDTDSCTRSTALWVLAMADPDIRAALAGLDVEGFGADLGLTELPGARL